MATEIGGREGRATAGLGLRGVLRGAVDRQVARVRRAVAGHLARRRDAVRRARLRDMKVVRERFTRAVEDCVGSSVRLQEDAVALLAVWSGGDGAPPPDELARLRAALAANARRRQGARTQIRAVRRAYGHAARRGATDVLRHVDALGGQVEEAVATRLRSLRDPERRLLLRASGPGSWTITAAEQRQADVEAALAAFRALTDERLRRVADGSPGGPRR